ncbi:hypothetical protein LZ31DRAFT_165526 [Colletotrichum somersetense]|nr:hypothetical protein LZ31DRAFT_165526 [Colletotrichum somersetense]
MPENNVRYRTENEHVSHPFKIAELEVNFRRPTTRGSTSICRGYAGLTDAVSRGIRIRSRDTEDKYVIRRPLLRVHEPSRTLHEDGHHGRLGKRTHLTISGAIYTSTAARRGSTGPQPASLRMREASTMPPRTMNDSSCYEEYDPRSPAPVTSPSAAMDCGHGRIVWRQKENMSDVYRQDVVIKPSM